MVALGKSLSHGKCCDPTKTKYFESFSSPFNGIFKVFC